MERTGNIEQASQGRTLTTSWDLADASNLKPMCHTLPEIPMIQSNIKLQNLT